MDDFSISIDGVTYPVFCGVCGQPISLLDEINDETGKAGCDGCDNIADVREVEQIARRFAIDGPNGRKPARYVVKLRS